MSMRTTPPFRADHVGSFLRPKRLLDAREKRAKGEISATELRRVEDEAITEIVKFQQDVGLKSITDGEFRRTYFHIDFLEQLGGVKTDIPVTVIRPDGTEELAPPVMRVIDKVRHVKDIQLADFQYLKSQLAPGSTAKVTIPSPTMLHFRGGRAGISKEHYPELEPTFYQDVANAYGDELRSLAAAGICMIPNLAPLYFVFVLMGSAGIHIDVATIMIASVVLGITVDDTIHLYHGYKERLASGMPAVHAIARSFESTGPAVMGISLLLIAQFGMLAMSNFIPTANFGLMTAIPILLAHAMLQTKTTELINSLESGCVKFLNALSERQPTRASARLAAWAVALAWWCDVSRRRVITLEDHEHDDLALDDRTACDEAGAVAGD